ncbi:MAG: HD domain-containing protein [Candidatus Peribacteraceae bacterium]|nr:HD domain-containing protein [Candidatus Peribacteraceae bacterium]
MENPCSAFAQISNLKHLPRAGWVRRGVAAPESVAGHLYRMAVLAMALEPRSGIDTNKLVRMILVHDLAESDPSVGDITPFDGISKEEKTRREGEAMAKLCRDLPLGAELFALFQEYEDGATPEARFAHQLDALEMGLQAKEYEAAQGIDLSEFVVSARKKISDPELLKLLESR